MGGATPISRLLLPVLVACAVAGCDRPVGPTGLASAALTVCGDGVCQAPVEDCVSCREDCEDAGAARVCGGDGIYEVSACGVTLAKVESCGPCGCAGDEGGWATCRSSCCGDGICATAGPSPESCGTCAEDCAAPQEGALVCHAGDIHEVDACAAPGPKVAECGVCGCDPLSAACLAACCGDGVCAKDEDCSTCPLDCAGEATTLGCFAGASTWFDACGQPVETVETCGVCGCDAATGGCIEHCCGDAVCDQGLPAPLTEACDDCPEDCWDVPEGDACDDGDHVVVNGCGAALSTVEACGVCGCSETGGAACVDHCCGDGACDVALGECASCSQDCAGTGACCGDGVCDAALGEGCDTCAADCDAPQADIVCSGDALRWVSACGVVGGIAQPCGACGCQDGASSCEDGCCGDGICGGDETCSSCQADCGCGPYEACDDGVCECYLPGGHALVACNCSSLPLGLTADCNACDQDCDGLTVGPGQSDWMFAPEVAEVTYVSGYQCHCGDYDTHSCGPFFFNYQCTQSEFESCQESFYDDMASLGYLSRSAANDAPPPLTLTPGSCK